MGESEGEGTGGRGRENTLMPDFGYLRDLVKKGYQIQVRFMPSGLLAKLYPPKYVEKTVGWVEHGDVDEAMLERLLDVEKLKFKVEETKCHSKKGVPKPPSLPTSVS